jgi:RHS repeat-associated protein
MGCLKLTYESEFCLSLAGDHNQTLGRRKKRAGTYKYKYNGKELQDELGLNTYDYGARFYDPATARWYSIDQMAEKYYDKSGYNYALNNPVIFIDPDGNEVEMCCDGLKKYLSGVLTGISNGAKQLISKEGLLGPIDAKGLAKQVSSIVQNPEKAIGIASPQGLVKTVENPEALGETLFDAGVIAVASKLPAIAKAETMDSQLQNLANEASATVGEGSGAVHGTKVHTEFGNQASKIKGVSTEVSYKDGKQVSYGTKGSVRADVVEGSVNKPKAVYDLKTGNAKLTNKNVQKYNQHLPANTPVKEIKPK